MRVYLTVVAVLHALFAVCELLPWSSPVLLRLVGKRLPAGDEWSPAQQSLVATIVHNAGIYNVIVAGGLLCAAVGDPAGDLARVLLLGAAVAGTFGTATLRSPLTALQALLGIVGYALT
jgi:uncharacterized membrane protein